MSYKQNKNPFKSSPLNNNNNDYLTRKVTNTEYITDLGGDEFATKRTITTDPTRGVETPSSSDQAFLDSFSKEYAKAQEGGFPGTLPEYIKQKEKKLGYAGSEVKQERDYNVENTPKYKVDADGRSYITVPYGNPENKIFKRQYHYPTYNTGHYPKGTLVSENEMLGNLYEKFSNAKAKEIYIDWVKRNSGRDVTFGGGSYRRDERTGGGGSSENKGDWRNVN